MNAQEVEDRHWVKSPDTLLSQGCSSRFTFEGCSHSYNPMLPVKGFPNRWPSVGIPSTEYHPSNFNPTWIVKGLPIKVREGFEPNGKASVLMARWNFFPFSIPLTSPPLSAVVLPFIWNFYPHSVPIGLTILN
ncbi:132aa long hypothetical protein [Pyrococcus horikoshii OT3]|uniref:Uncharacterized protein n=1 Tax=Pyrococcus horikoshii (strain ATCC 700860 / DSM 12428 / JCM 9974 / NBRC 100139 / OT-3) TaxID=70601 RepID=O58051_PYRHO|nr:132aa long hypothetical protein [Pyrococcus horikoshii OT3]